MTPTCPDCEAPLWLAACKCGWQAPPKGVELAASFLAENDTVESTPKAREAYARQLAVYASRAHRYRPSRNPFELPTSMRAHRDIEKATGGDPLEDF